MYEEPRPAVHKRHRAYNDRFNHDESPKSWRKPTEVIVEVDYTRRWIGSITINGILEAWQGDGSASQTVPRPQNTNKWVVGVSAQKLDGSRDMLTLRIKNSKGDLLEMLSTTAP